VLSAPPAAPPMSKGDPYGKSYDQYEKDAVDWDKKKF
jgi:hypothetical protein